MIEMNVPDQPFADLLARWVFQSEHKSGTSGGRTKFDEELHQRTRVVADFRPFRQPRQLFSDFTHELAKQPYFKYAEPLFARLLTAAAMRHGKGLSPYTNAITSFYRLGLLDAERFIKAARKLAAMNRPCLLFGRDCLALYRACYGLVKHVAYAEGLSRNLVNLYDSGSHLYYGEDPTQDLKVTHTKNYLMEIIKYTLPPKTVGETKFNLVLVDTGFSGSIPKAAFRALMGTAAVGGPGKDDVRMLTSRAENYPEWDLGLSRDHTVKAEYRPKVFFRASTWLEVSKAATAADSFFDPPKRMFARYGQKEDDRIGKYTCTEAPPITKSAFIPKLFVTGDAINTAAYTIGIMAATAKERYDSDPKARG